MKKFSSYQHLEGEEMNDRDKMEIGSKFWNTGKWDNFVLPFLPKDCSGLTYVDMGCNAGLFLALAQKKGFTRVVGVDSDKEAVKRGLEWRDKNNGNYTIIESKMENVIEKLPVADYTSLVNSHYYFQIEDWLNYIDRLRYKTRYCIIVTAEKRFLNRCWVSADVPDIRSYFKDWDEVGFIDELPFDDNGSPRRLWGLMFKSRDLDRVSLDTLDCGNHVQDKYYQEVDSGVDYQKTRYYRILEKYRKNWPKDYLNHWIQKKLETYEDIKSNGIKRPLIVDSKDKVLDGNHRYSMLKTLGFTSAIIRKV